MPIIKTKTTFLQMRSSRARNLPPPRADVEVRHLEKPTVEQYLRLYRAVGGTFYWVDRLQLSAVELLDAIHAPGIEIFELQVAAQAAGFAELDRRTDDIEIVYFGLVTQFIGQGLGKYFLDWTIRQAWSYEPRRLWLHTCDLDHEAALPNYLRAGFEIYDEKMRDQFVPDEMLS